MILTVKDKNDRQKYVIKIQYDWTKPIMTQTKDEWQRLITTTWRERKTTVTITPWNENGEPVSRTIFMGTTTCHYKDKYDKRVGREVAFRRCLTEMYEQEAIDEDEFIAMTMADLSKLEDEVEVKRID